MPIIPTYTKREFIKTPSVDMSAPAPARLQGVYENNLTRAGKLIPAAVQAVSSIGEQPGAAVRVSVQADENVRLREQLVSAVQKEIADKGGAGVNALEASAAKHFQAGTADETSARDYAVLRRAAQEAQEAAASAKAQSFADTEQTLVRQVGALVRSPEALDEYLSGQLASYEKRLVRGGMDDVSARTQALSVRAQTVEENIGRSLSGGDWRAAESTLAKHGSALPESVRQTCADKTRALFARTQAEKLWQEAKRAADGSPTEIHRNALANLQEPDAELNASMRHGLNAILQRETARKHASAADVLSAAARLPSADALRLLDGQTVLSEEELAFARQAALFFDGDTTASDEETFVTCYFGGEQKAHIRLFKRGKISARDYVRLEAARHRRAGGESQRAQQLLCRGIDVWTEKKGFSRRDAYAAQYAVLTADAAPAALADVWKQIKNLLDV